MNLSTCSGCKGLVPSGASRCPNCQRAATPAAMRWARGALAAVGSGVAAVTLMACYGGPCVSSNACGEGSGAGGTGGNPGQDAGNIQNYQYCPWPDGGLYPCWPDGGEVDLGQDAGPSDGG